jgi:hemolysin activation/secretion protein
MSLTHPHLSRLTAAFTLSTLALACASAFAQTTPSAAQVQQGDILLRQAQERLKFEQERAQRQQAPSGVDLKSVMPRVDASQAKGNCHNITNIDIVGANLLDADDKSALVRDLMGRCLGAPDIEKLMGEVTRHYIERGFITTRAYLPAQDLSSGKLQLLVVEGRIESLRVEGDPDKRINLGLAVPARAGDLLNMRDLEQAVDQINAVSGNKVKLDLVPGTKAGETVVVFRNKESNVATFEGSADNQGSEATGKNSVSGTLTVGGALGLNDILALTYRTSSPYTAKAGNDSVSLGLTVPNGYSTYGISTSVANYSTGLTTPGGLAMVAFGKSTTWSLTAERVVARNQDSRHAMVATLSNVDSKNYIDMGSMGTIYVNPTSRSSTSIAAGLKSTMLLAGGNFSLHPELALGLNEMSNLPAGINAASNGPQAEFTKATVDMSFEKHFDLSKQDWSWNSTFRGQYSADQLLSSQQLLIGGIGSVRGFVTNSLSGDSGYFWRNELGLNHKLTLGDTRVSTKTYIGYDMGSVSGNAAGAVSGQLGGLVVGFSAQFKAANVELSWTRADKAPASMTSEEAQTWLRISFSL